MLLSALLGREITWRKCERLNEQNCVSVDISDALHSPGKGLMEAFEMLKKSEYWQLDKRELLIEKVIDGADHWPCEVQAYLHEKLLGDAEKLPLNGRGVLYEKLKTRRRELETNVLACSIATYGAVWSCFKLAVVFGTPLRRLWSKVLFPAIVPTNSVSGFPARSRVFIYGSMRALSWCCMLGAFAAKGLRDGYNYATLFRPNLEAQCKTKEDLRRSAAETKILMEIGSQAPRYGTKDFELFQSTFTPQEEAAYHMLYLKTRLVSCTVGYLLGRLLAYPIAFLYMKVARRAFLPLAFHGYSVTMQNDIIATMLHFIALPIVPLYLRVVKSRNYDCAIGFVWVQRMSTSSDSAKSLLGNPDALPYEVALQRTRNLLLWLLDPQKIIAQESPSPDDFDDDILPEITDSSGSANSSVLVLQTGNTMNEDVSLESHQESVQHLSSERAYLTTALADRVPSAPNTAAEKHLEGNVVEQNNSIKERSIADVLQWAKLETEEVDSLYTGEFFNRIQNERLFGNVNEEFVSDQEQLVDISEQQEHSKNSRYLQSVLLDISSFDGLMDTRPLQESFFTDRPCFSATPVRLRYDAQDFKRFF